MGNDQNINPTPLISPVNQTPLGYRPDNREEKGANILRSLLMCVFLFLIIVCSIAVYYVFKPQIEKQFVSPALDQINKILTPAPTADTTLNPDSIGANWKNYTDKFGRFSFKYPPDFVVTNDDRGINDIYYVTLKNSKEEFRFSSGPKVKVTRYDRFATGNTEIINGITWIEVMSQEFCDPANCEATAPGYYVINKDYYIGVNQSDRINSKSSLKTILSTLKFTSTSPTNGEQIANPSPTISNNQIICRSNADCPSGSTCMTIGPLIAGQPTNKVCSQPGVANPL